MAKAAALVAQVSKDSKQGIIVAFGGRQYSRVDWRVVPAGEEKAARAHPDLRVKTNESAVKAAKAAERAAEKEAELAAEEAELAAEQAPEETEPKQEPDLEPEGE